MSPGLRRTKGLRVKRALFEAAIALFQEKGFDATSVDEIAERAGFSRATFFNHFKTKDGVLRFYGEHLRAQVEAAMLAVGPGAGPMHRLRVVLHTLTREAELHRAEARFVYLHSSGDAGYLAKPSPARQHLFELMQVQVAEAQQAGQIRTDLPAWELAFLVASLIQMAALAVVMAGRSAESMSEITWQMICGGVYGGNAVAP
ncbi:MAG: TetR/AcrR family transcriptional regulator [Bacillota bacterium]